MTITQKSLNASITTFNMRLSAWAIVQKMLYSIQLSDQSYSSPDLISDKNKKINILKPLIEQFLFKHGVPKPGFDEKKYPPSKTDTKIKKHPQPKTDTKTKPKKALIRFIDAIKNSVINRTRTGYKKVKKLFDGVTEKLTQERTLGSYKVIEYVSKDKKKYCLVIMMPTFIEEQTHISIHEMPSGRYTLKVIAQAERAMKVSNHPKDATYLPEGLLTSTLINEEDHILYYHDGKLEISITLPETVKPHSYRIEFENHALKIDFEQDIFPLNYPGHSFQPSNDLTFNK